MQSYIVKNGDTMFYIAARFGMTVSQLLSINPQIKNPANLYPGQMINLPTGARPVPIEYLIRWGDSLAEIAARYGITIDLLLSANPQIHDPNVIMPGDVIIIPVSQPYPGLTIYTVLPGDTLYTISQYFFTSVSLLQRVNPQIANTNQIYYGQKIYVPIILLPRKRPGCLVFIGQYAGQSEILRISPSGENFLNISQTQGVVDIDYSTPPKWSPDGKYIAFQTGNGFYITDACGNVIRKEVLGAYSFAWSNDVTRIAYSNADGIFSMDLTGNPTKISDPVKEFPVTDIQWFPGDLRLAFGVLSEYAYQQQRALGIIDVTGKNLKVFESPFIPANHLKLSPDGRYAGAVLYDYGDNNTSQVVNTPGTIYDFVTGRLKRFEYNFAYFGGWSPDSRMLIFTTTSGEPTGYQSIYDDLMILALDGTMLKKIRIPYLGSAGWGPTNDWVVYQDFNVNLLNIRTNETVQVWNIGFSSEGMYSTDWNINPCFDCIESS